MEQILLFILLVVAIALLALVLIQHGKGADIGAAFGSGASSTVFGSQGSASFLLKLTVGLAIVFFAVCILLTNLASRSVKQADTFQAPAPAKTQPAQKQAQPEQGKAHLAIGQATTKTTKPAAPEKTKSSSKTK